MMAKRDFYETLGVSKTAIEAELKSAFRKAAMHCHPDRHPGDKHAEANFKELNEAYQTCRTRRSARPTTATATRRSSRLAAWATASPRRCRIFSTICSAT